MKGKYENEDIFDFYEKFCDKMPTRCVLKVKAFKTQGW